MSSSSVTMVTEMHLVSTCCMSVSLASSYAPSQPRTLLSQASSCSHVVKENSGLCWDEHVGVQGKPVSSSWLHGALKTEVFLTGMTSAREETEPGEQQGRTDDCFRSDRSQLLLDSPTKYPNSMELESPGTQSLWITFNCSEIKVDLLSPPYLGTVQGRGEQSVSLRKKYRLKFCSQKTN